MQGVGGVEFLKLLSSLRNSTLNHQGHQVARERCGWVSGGKDADCFLFGWVLYEAKKNNMPLHCKRKDGDLSGWDRNMHQRT